MPKVQVKLKSKSSQLNVSAYQLEKDSVEMEGLEWFENLTGWDKLDDYCIVPNVQSGKDLIFEYTSEKSKVSSYYLIPFNDPQLSLYFEFIKQNDLRYIWCGPAFRNRNQLEEPEGIKVINTAREDKPGWWLTAAPALAGVMATAPIISPIMNSALHVSPLVGSAAILPIIAGVVTFPLVYVTNWLHYKLSHHGEPLSDDFEKKLWQDSMHRTGQVVVGFAMVEAIKPLMGHLFDQSLETAWGGAIQIGSSLAPAEIKAAVMLSVSVAVGLGVALGTALYQLHRKVNHKEDFNFTEIGLALVTGCVAGAVSTIDFGNKGFSFLATWAALCIFPVLNCATQEGRAQIKQDAKQTGAFFSSAAKALTPDCGTLEDWSDAMKHTAAFPVLGGPYPNVPQYY